MTLGDTSQKVINDSSLKFTSAYQMEASTGIEPVYTDLQSAA